MLAAVDKYYVIVLFLSVIMIKTSTGIGQLANSATFCVVWNTWVIRVSPVGYDQIMRGYERYCDDLFEEKHPYYLSHRSLHLCFTSSVRVNVSAAK